MNVRAAMIGDPRPRSRVLRLGGAVVLLASGAFLVRVDAVLSLQLLAVPALALALYAGWGRAGVLAGVGAVFLVLLWRFVFPPLLGYLRWSWDGRYTPPRVLGYKLDPRGELIEGVTYGPVYALVAAFALGGAAYLLGALVRRFGGRRAVR